jgi:hypothetical protein
MKNNHDHIIVTEAFDTVPYQFLLTFRKVEMGNLLD